MTIFFQLRLWTQARQMGSYAAKCMWASQVREENDGYFEYILDLNDGKRLVLSLDIEKVLQKEKVDA